MVSTSPSGRSGEGEKGSNHQEECTSNNIVATASLNQQCGENKEKCSIDL